MGCNCILATEEIFDKSLNSSVFVYSYLQMVQVRRTVGCRDSGFIANDLQTDGSTVLQYYRQHNQAYWNCGRYDIALWVYIISKNDCCSSKMMTWVTWIIEDIFIINTNYFVVWCFFALFWIFMTTTRLICNEIWRVMDLRSAH